MLEVMTLSNAQSFYNFTSVEINEQAIRDAFEVASSRYSELLVFFVSICFSKTPERRYQIKINNSPDFAQFASVLEPY
jgi:hypothetical protein